MKWLELSVRVSQQIAPLVESLLQNEPVLALTMTDDADDPVLEPGVGETPLWPSVCVTALFSGGHVLLEGVPGLGKTELVKTLSEVLDLEFRRIQFTPDLMPADIVGTNIMSSDGSGSYKFEFRKGPIFTQLLLADEINRATPKTQSALLETMQEGTVTTSGTIHVLDQPFDVRGFKARDLMEVIDAKPVQHPFQARVDPFESLEIVARPERLHHHPGRRPGFTAALHLELGIVNSALQVLDVVEHPFVDPVKHFELGRQARTAGMSLA